MQVQVNISSTEDLAILEGLSHRLGWEIKRNEKTISKKKKKADKEEPNGKAIAAILEKIAANGNMAKIIPDPSAWQREMRKDRKLHGR